MSKIVESMYQKYGIYEDKIVQNKLVRKNLNESIDDIDTEDKSAWSNIAPHLSDEENDDQITESRGEDNWAKIQRALGKQGGRSSKRGINESEDVTAVKKLDKLVQKGHFSEHELLTIIVTFLSDEDLNMIISEKERDLRSRGRKVENLKKNKLNETEETGLNITVPFDKVNVANLTNILSAKGPLIRQALQIEDLRFEMNEDSITFRWFERRLHADEVKAYSQFIAALCEMSRRQKRISATEKPVASEREAFRNFLVRLGLTGNEYRTARKILMRHLFESVRDLRSKGRKVENLKKNKLNESLDRLEKRVKDMINSQTDESERKKYMEDVLTYGAISGIVNDLITYADTEQFFYEFKPEILELLNEYKHATGMDEEELFGDKWKTREEMVDAFESELDEYTYNSEYDYEQAKEDEFKDYLEYADSVDEYEDKNNKNLLAGFAFEEMTRKLYEEEFMRQNGLMEESDYYEEQLSESRGGDNWSKIQKALKGRGKSSSRKKGVEEAVEKSRRRRRP